MANSVSFTSINQQLDFGASAPITIDDPLVRALANTASIIPSKSPIEFLNLSGKIGVGPIIGPLIVSNSSYFPVNASSNLTFVTDIYQANVVWSSTTISGSTATLTSNGLSCSLYLGKNNVGQNISNTQLTASLYYGNTFIGSNSVYVSLTATVFNSNLVISSNTGSFVNNAIGFSAQTSSMALTATSNVVNGVISWSVTPNNSGVSINGNTVILSSTAGSAGQTNTQSYNVVATVSLNGNPITSGATTANLTATVYSSTFTFATPSDVAQSANTGPLTLSGVFTVSANAPGTVVTWSSTNISGTPATLLVNGSNLSANLYLVVANSSSVFAAANSVTQVTANLYSDSSKTNLLSSKSANVSLTGLVYGLDYTPTSNVTASGYSAQTATAQATATYKAGNFSWSSAVVSGSPVVTKANGTPNSNPATITISTQQSVIGSNTAVVSIYPSISYGSIIVTRPNQNVVVTANVMSTAGTIIGPTSNNQYANDGPLTSSVNLQLSPAAPSGIDARWSLQNLSGPASSITAAGDGQSANVYFAVAANTFAYSTSVSNVIVGLYDSSSNTLLSTRSIQTSLKVGTYGLTITQIPVNNVQSGYTAQTSIATLSASIKAGGFVFSSSNTSGVAPTFSPSGTTSNGTYTTGTGIWSLNTNGVTTNTTIESWSLILYDASNSSGGNQIISTPANTFTLTAQQNSYTFSLSGSTTNTQILGSTTSNVSTIITGSHDISGGTMSGWTTSNTTSGYYLTSNTTSAVVGYSTTVSQSAAVAYYTTTLTGTLLDANNRFVQTLSVPVVLRSYFPNVTLAFSSNNVVASGYTAQTASATVTSTCWIGATGFSLNHNLVSGGDFGYTAGTQNTSYQQWSYVTGNGSSPGTSFGVVNFQPSVTFYEKTSNNVTWSANGSLTANFYNPAVSLAVANNGVGGFVPPVTAYAVVTASSNVSGATYTWSSPQGVGGNGFTGTYTQSTNTQFVAYDTASSVGTISGTASYVTCNVYDSSSRLVGSYNSGSMLASATVYNPALVITGPTSNSQSNTFTSTASIHLVASANSSIPNVSYVCTASATSGSAAVSISSSNTVCDLSVLGRGSTNSASYNVSFSVYSGGSLLQTVSKSVSLSAQGIIPAYALTTGNSSSAGFNFAQTATSTCSVSNLTGGYAVWGMNVVSGSTPSWSTPGGSNSYINTTVSQGTVGSNSSTVNQTCYCYSPDGYLMKTLTSSNYSMSATVYNPAFTLTPYSPTVSGQGTQTAVGSVTMSSNVSGASYTLSWSKVSGATGSTTVGATSGTLTITASGGEGTVSGTYSATASCVLNGQTIAGPSSVNVTATATSNPNYTLSIQVIGTASNLGSGSTTLQVTSNAPSLGTVTWTANNWYEGGSGGSYSFTPSGNTAVLGVSGGSRYTFVQWQADVYVMATGVPNVTANGTFSAQCGGGT